MHGSFHDLEDYALNPLTLGVHTNEHYNRDGFPFKPFDPDYEQNWVWGYSLSQNRTILVPESIAYYSPVIEMLTYMKHQMAVPLVVA